MQIQVNGETRSVAENLTVRELLESLALGPGPVAVERNRSIVPRAQHGTTRLAPGDQLEIVQFVGGG